MYNLFLLKSIEYNFVSKVSNLSFNSVNSCFGSSISSLSLRIDKVKSLFNCDKFTKLSSQLLFHVVTVYSILIQTHPSTASSVNSASLSTRFPSKASPSAKEFDNCSDEIITGENLKSGQTLR